MGSCLGTIKALYTTASQWLGAQATVHHQVPQTPAGTQSSGCLPSINSAGVPSSDSRLVAACVGLPCVFRIAGGGSWLLLLGDYQSLAVHH